MCSAGVPANYLLLPHYPLLEATQQPMHVSSNISCNCLRYLHVTFQLATPPGLHTTQIPKGNLVFITEYVPMYFFGTFARFLRPPWVFSQLSAAGHAAGPPVNQGASLVPGRAPCSAGRSKPRNLASNHGVAFRRAEAEQYNGKPTGRLFCSTAVKAPHFVAAMVQPLAHQINVDHYYACVDIAHACLCRVC